MFAPSPITTKPTLPLASCCTGEEQTSAGGGQSTAAAGLAAGRWANVHACLAYACRPASSYGSRQRAASAGRARLAAAAAATAPQPTGGGGGGAHLYDLHCHPAGAFVIPQALLIELVHFDALQAGPALGGHRLAAAPDAPVAACAAAGDARGVREVAGTAALSGCLHDDHARLLPSTQVG